MHAAHTDWPMTAQVEILTDEGEWEHYAEIATVAFGEEWISKRAKPERWRVVLKPAPASNQED